MGLLWVCKPRLLFFLFYLTWHRRDEYRFWSVMLVEYFQMLSV